MSCLLKRMHNSIPSKASGQIIEKLNKGRRNNGEYLYSFLAGHVEFVGHESNRRLSD